MFTIFFKYLLSLINLPNPAYVLMSENSCIIKKHFQASKRTNKTENANLSCGEPKTPTALKLSVGLRPPHKSTLVERGYHGYQNSAVSWHLPPRNIAYSMVSLIPGAKRGPSFHHSLSFVINVDFKQS